MSSQALPRPGGVFSGAAGELVEVCDSGSAVDLGVAGVGVPLRPLLQSMVVALEAEGWLLSRIRGVASVGLVWLLRWNQCLDLLRRGIPALSRRGMERVSGRCVFIVFKISSSRADYNCGSQSLRAMVSLRDQDWLQEFSIFVGGFVGGARRRPVAPASSEICRVFTVFSVFLRVLCAFVQGQLLPRILCVLYCCCMCTCMVSLLV